MPLPLIIFIQSGYLIQIFAINLFAYLMANSADPDQLASSAGQGLTLSIYIQSDRPKIEGSVDLDQMRQNVVADKNGHPDKFVSKILLISTHDICFHGEIRRKKKETTETNTLDEIKKNNTAYLGLWCLVRVCTVFRHTIVVQIVN